MLRLTVNNQVITSYRTVVGKPGKTATPQLAEIVQGVVFNPTWTVPQSIVKGEGMGARLLANPRRAEREGFKVTKGANGFINVVQQPGPGNSLGLMKLDMPNPHAIFIHDTSSRHLFAAPERAFSHGCIRADRASELGMLMAMLGAGLTKEQGIAHTLSGEYAKVPMTKTFPVYITYFTMARDVNGAMRKFNDIYGRDAPVLASFTKPRQLHTEQRTTSEPVVEIVDDLGAI
jgi:murein L,D-transpeptidase YcbB/YkuD